MDAGVPILFDREAGNVQRTREHLQTIKMRQGLADVARQRGDQVGRADGRRQTQKTWQFEGDVARNVLLLQRLIEQIVRGAPENDDVLLATREGWLPSVPGVDAVWERLGLPTDSVWCEDDRCSERARQSPRAEVT